MEKQLSESAWLRAGRAEFKETWKSLLRNGIGTVAGGAVSWAVGGAEVRKVPERWPTLLIGGLLGIVGAYLVAVVVALVRQRNEARQYARELEARLNQPLDIIGEKVCVLATRWFNTKQSPFTPIQLINSFSAHLVRGATPQQIRFYLAKWAEKPQDQFPLDQVTLALELLEEKGALRSQPGLDGNIRVNVFHWTEGANELLYRYKHDRQLQGKIDSFNRWRIEELSPQAHARRLEASSWWIAGKPFAALAFLVGLQPNLRTGSGVRSLRASIAAWLGVDRKQVEEAEVERLLGWLTNDLLLDRDGGVRVKKGTGPIFRLTERGEDVADAGSGRGAAPLTPP